MKPAILLAVALSLSACVTPITPPSAAVAVAQGDTALDAAYNVAATAYVNQLPTMSPALKSQVKPILVKAYSLVQAADAAEKLGDATTLAAQANDAMTLINQAKAALRDQITMTLAEIEAALEEGLSFVSKVAPLASLGGPAAGAIGVLVGQIASTADTIINAISNDATIIAGGDLTKITALQTQLQAQNAALAAQIADS